MPMLLQQFRILEEFIEDVKRSIGTEITPKSQLFSYR